jgi:phenylalanyl-tRNA synthetase alpha chain
MEQQLNDLRQTAMAELQAAGDREKLNEIRVKYLGKKGTLTSLLKGLGNLSPEERPRIGQLVNKVRAALEEALSAKTEEIHEAVLEKRLASEKIDVTLPGRKVGIGHKHPVTLTMNRIKEIYADGL